MTPSVEDKLAHLSMTCANPSDHLSAGVWCEAANEAYMLARGLFEQLESLRDVADHHIAEAERSEKYAEGRDLVAQKLEEQLESVTRERDEERRRAIMAENQLILLRRKRS